MKWHGAVQAQDYLGAKVGPLYVQAASDKVIEKAFADGEILQTHYRLTTNTS